MEAVRRTGCAECGQSCHHFSVCEIHTFVFQLAQVSESSFKYFSKVSLASEATRTALLQLMALSLASPCRQQ